MTALIEYVCSAHRQEDGIGPKITIHEGAWALCPARREDAHEWLRIEPTRREFIGDLSQVQKLEAS